MDKQVADYISKLQKLLRGNMTNENAENICKEIESHLAEKAADLEATGISRHAAVAMAIEEFGKPEKVASTFIGAGLGLKLFGWVEWTAVLSLIALELIIVYTLTTEAAEGQLRPLLTMLVLLAVTFVVSIAFCRRILIAPFACAAALGGLALTCSVSYAHVGPMRDNMGLMRESDLQELAAQWPRVESRLLRQRKWLVSGLTVRTESDAEQAGLRLRRGWRIPVYNRPSFLYLREVSYIGMTKTWTEAQSVWFARGEQTLRTLDEHLAGAKSERSRINDLLRQGKFSDFGYHAGQVFPFAAVWLAITLGLNAIFFVARSAINAALTRRAKA